MAKLHSSNKCYKFVRNDDVRRLTKQPKLTAIIQSCRLTLFGHIMRMDDNADAKRILLASPPADWRRQLGSPRITWLSTVQQNLKQHHLTLPEAADLAQNCPLWRMMSTYSATQSWVACQKRRTMTKQKNNNKNKKTNFLLHIFPVKAEKLGVKTKELRTRLGEWRLQQVVYDALRDAFNQRLNTAQLSTELYVNIIQHTYVTHRQLLLAAQTTDKARRIIHSTARNSGVTEHTVWSAGFLYYQLYVLASACWWKWRKWHSLWGLRLISTMIYYVFILYQQTKLVM